MPIVIINFSLISGPPSPIPNAIAPAVTEQCWLDIRHSLSDSQTKGQCYGCALEFGICFISGIFCVFCAHPCIATSVSKSLLESQLRYLNSIYFGGRRVLSSNYDLKQLVVNLDNFYAGITNHVVINQPTYTQPSHYPPQPGESPNHVGNATECNDNHVVAHAVVIEAEPYAKH